MDKMKEPALLWCGANTLFTAGGLAWLYQINTKLATQLAELAEIVKGLNEQDKKNIEQFKKNEEALTKMSIGLHAIANQLGHQQEFLEYLSNNDQIVTDEIIKTNAQFALPKKPTKVRKLLSAMKKKKKQSDSDSSSSDSDSDEEDPIELLKKKREAKKKAKSKKSK